MSAEWEERGFRRSMEVILPRLRIMAVMGMFSSRASHTWVRGREAEGRGRGRGKQSRGREGGRERGRKKDNTYTTSVSKHVIIVTSKTT